MIQPTPWSPFLISRTCNLSLLKPALSLDALAGARGLPQPIWFTQQQTRREHGGEKGLNRDLISRNPSLWEVRNHTLLPANTLAKVSRRDPPVPSCHGTAAEDTETHPHGPPPSTHTPPVSSSPGHTRTQGSDRKTNSQDLQITQRSEGSIFNAADVVVVQLPVEKQGGEREG